MRWPDLPKTIIISRWELLCEIKGERFLGWEIKTPVVIEFFPYLSYRVWIQVKRILNKKK
jgi:hypothetical protein